LVQAAELWVPQGEVMALGSGAYRGHEALEAGSVNLRFHYGEGLSGAVWANNRALLWKDLTVPFVRAELAQDSGIDAAVGIPLFDGDRLVAVLTFLLGHRAEVPSCLEVWDVMDELDVLKHGKGYYVHCSEFERFSPFIQFPRGTGLPGLTWRSGVVEVMDDVRKSNAFIRAGLAARCGLKFGLGIPIYRDRRVAQVLALFGGEQRSLVKSAELYHPRDRELGAAMLFDWSGPGSARGESLADAPSRQLAQEVLSKRTPALLQNKHGGVHEITVALPIHDRKGLRQILVLGL
jgi:putative methionine-R-sulfoxide reductase with GAF domain